MITQHFSSQGSLQQLEQMVQSILEETNPDGLIILGSVDNHLDDSAADLYFRMLDRPVAGGLFTAIIHKQAVHHSGWLVYAVTGNVTVDCTQQLSLPEGGKKLQEQTDKSATSTEADIKLVVVDGHANNIASYLTQVYADSNITTKFFGGGAGSHASTRRRCVICNAGLLLDAAVVMRLQGRSGIGVSHGWRPTSPILRATSTSGNTVHELNFRPALDVYREIIQSEFNATIDPNDLIGSASLFSLGIRRMGGSIIVRDPIATTTEGGLVCVGEFDDNCFVYVLTSAMDELLASTAQATHAAEVDLGSEVEQKIVFDCISRFLLMKDQFDDELAMLNRGSAVVSGVLSIGEIAGGNDGILEFYNKTTTVAAFAGE